MAQIIHTWKSYTAHEIKKVLREEAKKKGGVLTGESPVFPGDVARRKRRVFLENELTERIWQIEYWDRFIRDERHYQQAVSYIHENPVKAGLCEMADEWRWSSVA